MPEEAVGIQVAKLGEAELMVDAGLRDVLVGYPIVGEAKVERLITLAEAADVTVSLDSLEVAAPIAEAAARRGATIRMLVELDTGLSRIGVLPGAEAVALAERIADLPAVRLAGVLTHEGHAYSQAGSVEELRTLTREACEQTVATAREIEAQGIPVPVVSVGSSGTFRFAVEVDGVTEVRPGTYVFNDRTQVARGAASDRDLAAAVIATVVSGPREHEVVIDAGSKTLTSDRMISKSPIRHVRARPHSRRGRRDRSPQRGARSCIVSGSVCGTADRRAGLDHSESHLSGCESLRAGDGGRRWCCRRPLASDRTREAETSQQAEFDGQVVLIAGAGRGIGFACAEAFASRGATVAIADVASERLADAHARITAGHPGGHSSHSVDLAEVEQAERLTSAALEEHGRIRARQRGGILETRPFLELTQSEWDRTVAVNSRGAVFLAQQSAATWLRVRAEVGSS